jgi:hypothetical protein
MSTRTDTIARFARLKAEALSTEPVTEEDRRLYRTLDARQRARDEARRAEPSPQMQLPEAA